MIKIAKANYEKTGILSCGLMASFPKFLVIEQTKKKKKTHKEYYKSMPNLFKIATANYEKVGILSCGLIALILKILFIEQIRKKL